MPDWVATYKPYQRVELVELRTGTVLRRVPFPVMTVGATTFGVIGSEGEPQAVTLTGVTLEAEVVRSDKVVVSPGIILTPDCDIFQHKCNRVVVAQLVSVESHIKNQELNSDKAKRFRESVSKARESNPGAFNQPGLFPMLGDKDLGFGDHVVLLENLVSIPIEFAAGQKEGMQVSDASVNGLDNIWFWIQHPELRARLTTEFTRHMLRIGLQDA